MADFIKKKIVEVLAKFTKDLKPDDISLNFLRGKGELRNLELNAELINDVLRLPPWIAVRKVHCDSIRVSVPFTDLHRSPIHAVLGKVVIQVKTCDEEEEELGDAVKAGLRQKLKMKQSSGSYGLVEKIVDGMKIEVRSVLVLFDNPLFEGRLEISDVMFQSTTPNWKPAILSHCRYKNEEEGSIIIYKKCTWTSLKVEGWEVVNEKKDARSQLRLFTDDTEIHIALKRSIADCSIMHMRVSVHLGDISWVLTQSQLKAASMLAQSLLEAGVKWAQKEREEQSRWRGSQESIDSVSMSSVGYPEEDNEVKKKPRQSRRKGSKDQMKMVRLGQLEWEYQQGRRNLPAYEVIQDSFHIRTGKVNLQLCDDRGSLLLQLKDLIVDIYLDQAAASGRCHWHRANSKLEENAQWSTNLVRLASKVQHVDLPSVNLYKLRERSFIVRCAHFQICSTGGPSSDLPIIASDKETFKIPDVADNPAIQCGLTMYYYTADHAHRFLVPRPNLFVHMAPVHVSFHQQYCLWLVEFVHGVLRTVNLNLALAVLSETSSFLETIKSRRSSVKQLPGIDIDVFVPYTKVTLPLQESYSDGRPRALQLETSSIHLQNRTLVSLFDSSSFLAAWEDITTSWLFTATSQFPHSDEDPAPIPNILVELISREIKARRNNTLSSSSSYSMSTPPLHRNSPEWERRHRRERQTADEKTFSKLSLEQLKLSTLECWDIATDCVIVSLVDDLTHKATLYTTEFISDFPLSLWLFQPSKIAQILETSSSSSSSLPMLHLMVHSSKPLKVQLEHLHFLFLMRLKDSFQTFKNRLMDLITLDSIITTQEEEAFHFRLTEGEDELTEGDSSDGRDFKDRFAAAITKISHSDRDLESKEDDEEDEQVATDDDNKPVGSPILTVGAALMRVEVKVGLPSVLTTHRNRQTQTTPTPPALVNATNLSRPSQLAPSISSPSVVSEPQTTSANRTSPALPTSVSLPQLASSKGGSGGKVMLVGPERTSYMVTALSQVSSEDELSGEFLMVNVPSSSSSNSSVSYLSSQPTATGVGTIALSDVAAKQDRSNSPEEGKEVTLTASDLPDVATASHNCAPSSLPPSIEVTPPPPPCPPPLSSEATLPNPSPSSTTPSTEILPTLFVSVGVARLVLSLSPAGIQVCAAVDAIALDELTEEDLADKKEQSVHLIPQECPVIKARVELGKTACRYFLSENWEPDAAVFLKVAGIKSSLSLKTVMALKDFFDDEVEADLPMPIQLRIIETKFLLRDTLFSTSSCPRNLTVNIPDLFINRGPRAQGTNLVPVSPPDVEDQDTSTGVPVPEGTEKVLMEAFREFIRALQNHLKQTGEETHPGPEQISQLLHQLQEGLPSPPSYTEAISCNFYSNLTKQVPHQTVASMEAEVERLKRENEQLKEEFGSVSLQHVKAQEEMNDVTRQLVDAKVNLASAHLVLERQKLKIEHLSNEKMTLEEQLRVTQPSSLL